VGGTCSTASFRKEDVMILIEEIKKTVKMEIRTTSKEMDYLEGVVKRAQLGSLQSVLEKHLGSAAKEPGKEVKLPGEIQKKVDSMGGLRVDQSFYYKKEGSKISFAALWPWESNPEKITLKSGLAVL
jgi:hypothetical protein